MGEFEIKIVKYMGEKSLSPANVLLAKKVICGAQIPEEVFLQNAYEQLSAMGIRVKKMLAGLEKEIHTDHAIIHTRSLMLANLSKTDSILLQEKGLHEHRMLGCGLFLPQKDIQDLDTN
jgi:hypothetical protein